MGKPERVIIGSKELMLGVTPEDLEEVKNRSKLPRRLSLLEKLLLWLRS